MDGNSLNIAEEKLQQLREIVPEAFAEGKIDIEKLKFAIGEENVEMKDERYVLNWAGKSDAFRSLQAPTTATLEPAKEESVDFDTTENLFIEGENLEVLKVLQKAYFGKVKMIYIDPPYNTGNDHFIYPDRFAESKEDYLERVGDKDEEGRLTREGFYRKNSKENGHFHSNWLSMMYPRLFLARNLLREDGVIFVSIDDNEVHNLRMLMNEVFGEENLLGTLVWKNATDNNPSNVAVEHEYALLYSRSRDSIDSIWKSKLSDIKEKVIKVGDEFISTYPDSEVRQRAYSEWFKKNKKYLWPLDRYKFIDEGGIYTGSQSVHNPGKEGYRYDVLHPETNKPCKEPLMGYRFPENTMKDLLEKGKILFGEDESKIIELKVYAFEYQEKLSSVLDLDGRLGAYDLRQLFPKLKKTFTNPKPVRLLTHYFQYILNAPQDIILDFFSGSGTTAHAVLDLNKEDGGDRKFICVQMPEECDEKTEAFKAGYKTIAEIGKERIRRAIKKIKAEQEGKLDFGESKLDLGFKSFKLRPSNFKIWRSSAKSGDELGKELDLFSDPVKKESGIENIMYELLLKSGIDLNAKIEEQNGSLWVNDGEVALLLATISPELIDSLAEAKPQKILALDRLFAGNDQLKGNAGLRFKDAGIDFKTV